MKTKISIADVVGTDIWVSVDDGQRVFEVLAAALRAGGPVELSFRGREQVITAFLNSAVGQIYGHPDLVEAARNGLEVVDADGGDMAKLKLVVDNAKAYFAERNGRADREQPSARGL